MILWLPPERPRADTNIYDDLARLEAETYAVFGAPRPDVPARRVNGIARRAMMEIVRLEDELQEARLREIRLFGT